jgi:hypothetical protein
MRPNSKKLALSLLVAILGFSLPIIIITLISRDTFKNAFDQAPVALDFISDGAGGNGSSMIIEKDLTYAWVNSDEFLDPKEGKTFIISVVVKLDELPANQTREKIIAKYETNKHPYSGWALAFNNQTTSTRPAVYWKNAKAKGGWYNFEEVKLATKRWYAFSVVIKDSNKISMYYQPLRAVLESGDAQLSESSDPTVSFSGEQLPVYLGTYDVTEIGLPQTSANLFFGKRSERADSFKGDVARVLIAQSETIPKDIKKIEQFLDGGPSSIAARIEKNEITFLMLGKAEDASQFNRKVNLGVEDSKEGI